MIHWDYILVECFHLHVRYTCRMPVGQRDGFNPQPKMGVLVIDAVICPQIQANPEFGSSLTNIEQAQHTHLQLIGCNPPACLPGRSQQPDPVRRTPCPSDLSPCTLAENSALQEGACLSRLRDGGSGD